jgi:hypothetical protein
MTDFQEIKGGLHRYKFYGLRPGSFLEAVLKNNLVEACLCADPYNARELREIVKLCLALLPSESWGSSEAVEAWIEARNADR